MGLFQVKAAALARPALRGIGTSMYGTGSTEILRVCVLPYAGISRVRFKGCISARPEYVCGHP